MNRRSLLTAAPAFGIAGLISTGAVPAIAATETPVMRLFRRYMTVRDAWLAETNTSMDHDDEVASRLSAIEAEMVATPCRTAQDMAAKMVVAHAFGDHSCLDYGSGVWTEAREMIAA